MRKHRAFLTLGLILALTISVCAFWRELSMGLTAIISPSQLQCYWSGSRGVLELGQGEWDEPMLVPSRCLFFHETTCSSASLTARQACAVESAARSNRNLNVFLLFFASDGFSEGSQPLVKILETYDNVYIRRVRLSKYVIDTPIEDWFSANIRTFSESRVWLRRDFHDYIRMLTLWKFGGVALDLNYMVRASLDELTTFVNVQNERDKDIGVFGVDTSTDFGRKFIDVCMEIIKNTNMNNYLRYNITKIVAEALQKFCYQPKNKECRQFTIYPATKLYPIYSWTNGGAGDAKVRKATQIMRNASTIHRRNNHSQDTMAAYKMATKYCPMVYKFAAKDF